MAPGGAERCGPPPACPPAGSPASLCQCWPEGPERGRGADVRPSARAQGRGRPPGRRRRPRAAATPPRGCGGGGAPRRSSGLGDQGGGGGGGEAAAKRKRECASGAGASSIWEAAKSLLRPGGKAPVPALNEGGREAVRSPKRLKTAEASTSGAAALLGEQLECIICREPMVGAHALVPCGHTFCAECAHQWLAQKNSCPTCRKKTTADPVPVLPFDNLISKLIVPGLPPEKRAAHNEKLSRWDARRREMREKAAATRTAPTPPRGPDFMATFVTVGGPPPDGGLASGRRNPFDTPFGQLMRAPVVIHGRIPAPGSGNGGPAGGGQAGDLPPILANILQQFLEAGPTVGEPQGVNGNQARTTTSPRRREPSGAARQAGPEAASRRGLPPGLPGVAPFRLRMLRDIIDRRRAQNERQRAPTARQGAANIRQPPGATTGRSSRRLSGAARDDGQSPFSFDGPRGSGSGAPPAGPGRSVPGGRNMGRSSGVRRHPRAGPRGSGRDRQA